MIHIATVHHRSCKWIELQCRYLNHYMRSGFKIYAFTNGINRSYPDRFFLELKDDITNHAEKLNILSEHISAEAEEDDVIVFMDGDAVPITELDVYIHNVLKSYSLLAVKRDLDFGDIQPHPSFCATRVGFWKDIGGDWLKGYWWKNTISKKDTTDVGGKLLELLEKNRIDWYPLQRTRSVTDHPQWFGIYDNAIYHHGAGFRKPISKIDRYQITTSFNKFAKILSKILFIRGFLYTGIIRKNSKLGDKIFRSLMNDISYLNVDSHWS